MPADTDEDEVPDYLDPNSDGDGDLDIDEGTGDVDCDGTPNWLDSEDDDAFCDDAQDDPTVDPDGFEPPDAEDDDVIGFESGKFTGGACSVTPLGSLGFPSVLALLALARRRRRAVAVAAGLGVASTAGAQELNAQRFAPSVDSRSFLKLESAELAPAASMGAGLFVNHADDPFVFRPEGDLEEVKILDSVTTSSLLGFYSFGGVRVGIDVPIHMYAAGLEVDSPVNFGDMRLSGKAVVPVDLPVDLGGYVDLTLPTGAAGNWVGAGRTGLRTGAIGSRRFGRLLASANLGIRTGTTREIGELAVSPGFLYGVGVGYEVVTDAVVLTAEVEGDRWFGNSGQSGARPAEWLAGARFNPVGDLIATLGAGSGLSQGVGAPDVRIVGGVSWTPGKVQTTAEMPVVTEPPPIPMAEPEPVPGSLVVRAITPNGEPVKGAQVRVIGHGGPTDTGKDGILEQSLDAGTYQVAVSAPEWTTVERTVDITPGGTDDLMIVLRPTKVLVDADTGDVYLHRKVFFELNKAELKLESFPVLDDLVETLDQNPDIAVLRVEGHTDITGTDEYNLALSQRRAQAVVDYLVKAGVPTTRVVAKGMGETRVLQQGDSEDVHATNRRVEFHIQD